jgi:hypothetical protein
MKNYIQQNEGTSLFKRDSFIDLASCPNKYLQNVLFTKYCSRYTCLQSFVNLIVRIV